MGFLDKAKAAANDLAAKADGAMAQAGINTPGSTSGTSAATDRLLRDLGVLAYLDATGRAAPEGERDRVMAGLREAEQQGGFSSFALRTTPPPPPGMGGAPGAPGMPSSQSAPPPPPPGQPEQAPPPPPPASAPPSAPSQGLPPQSMPPAPGQGTPPPPPPPPGWS
ncbi:hypothetical protein GCM10022415_11970 [Knoellia locipacati]|uniref:Uncharacterized protein n=1 Tax=Knoellia locipacati TaxID=882824 RepID=A0A512SYW2_9MICO|nr:hypothetical protein [Knoellia locipacati]GEQ13148.1 hypothetical protein KLO01_11950 [Knoellia locipacati]